MNFGEKLKKLREERGVYQRDLAVYIGVTPTTISYYEANRKKPQMEKLNKIAEFFGVTVDYLLGQEKSIDNLEDEFPEGIRLLRRANKELSDSDKEVMADVMKSIIEARRKKN